MLPNFLIIGAHKAGTTSLYHYLKSHPKIYMPERKELRFFAFDESNPEHLKRVPSFFPITTLKAYEAYFDAVINEEAIGEATPEYLNSTIAPYKIKKYIPDAILIISLRHPVDRMYSEYLMRYRMGLENRSFIEAFRAKPHWVETSLYYDRLKRYYKLFPREHIEVILFDDLHTSPTNVAKELYGRLGVDQGFVPDIAMKHNKGGLPRNRKLYKWMSNPFLRHTSRRLLPNNVHRKLSALKRWNLRQAPNLKQEERHYLMAYCKNDILQVQEVINKDLNKWIVE